MSDGLDDSTFSSQVEYEPYEGEELDLDANNILTEFVDKGLIGDKYKNIEHLAQGGMGVVYRAHDIGLDRTTVLKVINPETISNADLFTRFVEEARITGQLEHPNIIPVHDIGVLNSEQLYFSMKFIKGRELREIIEDIRQGVPSAKSYTLFNLLTIFRKVCDAAAFAHSRNIIHRDIKPDNIMVGRYGEVLLVDWGLARRKDKPEIAKKPDLDKGFLDGFGSGSVTKTRFGIIKGTPAYMAPEMALGEVDRVDERSDIFLLGATLYALASLEAPYTDEGPDDIYKILQRAENADFVPPSERAPERQIPEELEKIILKAMAFDSQDRYQTVAELSEDIDALMEGRAQSTRRQFTAGDHLMQEGEEGREAYVITKGEVEVYKVIEGKRMSLVRLGIGSTVGEMALIDDAPRSASVVALSDTEAVVIDAEILKQCLGKMPPWMGQAISSLTERLRNANADIHPLLRNDCIYQVMSLIRFLFPFCGSPYVHPETGQPMIALDAEKILLEVSTQLCISPEKVLDVMGRLLRTGLIIAVDADNFVIPNFSLYCKFIDYSRRMLGQPSGLPLNQKAKLFVGQKRLALSLSQPLGSGPSLPEIEEVSEIPMEEILGISSEDDLEACFNELMERLKEDLG